MSELIDSIFDVAKISKEVANITADLDGLKQTIVNYSADVKKAMDATRASKSQDDLLKNTKSINDAMSGAQKVTKEYQTELEKLKAKTDQLTGAEKAANIEIAKARLELAAAQKEVKAAAVAEIEAAAATGKLEKNFFDLKKELAATENEFKNLTLTEQKSAKGKELQKKYTELREQVDEVDESFQHFQGNVGNYESGLKGLFDQARKGEIGLGGLVKGIWGTIKASLAFLATPLGAALGAIAVVVGVLVKAFSRSEESMNKVKQIGGALSGVFGGLMNALKPVVEFIADKVLKAFEELGNIAEKATGLVSKGLRTLGFDKAAAGVDKMTASVKENAKAGQELAKLQAQQTVNERELNRIRFEYLKEQERFRQIRDDVSKSTTERIAANDALGASLIKQAKVEREILDQALYIANERVKIDGATSENLDKVAEAKANIADLEERINGFQSEQLVNAVGIRKEAEDLAKAQAQLITDAQRRLSDAKLAAMAEGEEKQIAISKENLKRQLEDLKTNGQLTTELQKNLEAANANEIQKIKDDFAKQAEDKRKEDFEKQLADFEKKLQREVAILEAAYNDQAVVLKKQFAAGKLSRKEYDEALIKLQSDAAKEANNKTIELLKSELEIYGISADKKAELSAKIRDLQIANENAVLDATIEANEKKAQSDKDNFDKRLKIAEELANVGLELYAAVGEFQTQQSEQHIEELEAQQAKSDELFEKQQANLDRAAMSEENRVLAQQKLNEDKEKRDKAIADKVKAEKIRAAKWEKTQAIVSAGINTALAIIKALVDPGGILGAVYAVAAGITGAASIATIASKSIPAYAKGGVTGEGLALWGEERPEVAVTPTGHVMFAESPTVTNFDAGTRIFKSVEDYERNISATNVGKNFEFDYDKFAEAMPKTTVNLDSNGLWSVMKGQQNRVIIVNRKYKLN